MNIQNKNRRIPLWKSAVVLIILFTMNVLMNKTTAQEAVNRVPEPKDICTEKIITGKTNLEQLEQISEFWIEYLSHYANYVVDAEKLAEIGQELENRPIKIIAVIGSWCGDTKEQLPVLQKILDNLPKDKLAIDYIGVNRDKLADDLDISFLNIDLIPTFIFYENDQEMGRMVETPSSTMENDMIRILKKEK